MQHQPVLGREVVDLLHVQPGGTVVDGTFGAGGHARLLAGAMGGRGRYIAVDRDRTVAPLVQAFAAETTLQVEFRNADFATAFVELGGAGVSADAVILDLGVSSMQLDQPQRGFAYSHDTPLDMRMDQGAGLTAADVVNGWPESRLAEILREWGEERFARRIARAIVRRREEQPITTSAELVDVVRSALPPDARRARTGHPAKRVFQALRIAVNDEIGLLERALPAGWDLLVPGGRMGVISFHSLEDRPVKRFFEQLRLDCICPPEVPVCVCGKVSQARVITRKPVSATAEETVRNPRAASAKLRVAERLPDEGAAA